MKKYSFLVFIVLLGVLLSCNKKDDSEVVGSEDQQDWLIPRSEVRDGGPGKDGIPSIDNPSFVTASDVDFLNKNDLVVGIKVGTELKAYPHLILDWHEIVNDELAGFEYALTYCPLTGTASAWNRKVNNETTTFGVSGLLYNSNLMPYDRNTNSTWSQMRLDCVEGDLQGEAAATYPVLETTWENWLKQYPDSKVLSKNTGVSRSYGTYPYGDYRTSSRLLFPVNNLDERLAAKERVLGIIVQDKEKVYRFTSFPATGVLQEEFNGIPLVVFGSQTDNYLMAYQSVLSDGTVLTFEAVNTESEAIVRDQEGNEWNVFGEAVSGGRKGQQLLSTRSYIGYFFSWGAFYPSLEIQE